MQPCVFLAGVLLDTPVDGPRRAVAVADVLFDAIADAGAFSVVIEGVVEHLAAEITREIPIVTIGIGASSECDGQVLVTEDAMGMFTDFTPKFVKRFAEMGEEMSKAAAEYAKEVKARTFPADEHCYGVRKDGK